MSGYNGGLFQRVTPGKKLWLLVHLSEFLISEYLEYFDLIIHQLFYLKIIHVFVDLLEIVVIDG